MKPREFYIYKTQKSTFASPTPVDAKLNAIHCREVVPIDWEKVWNMLQHSEQIYDDQKENIKRLVEKQIAGE